MRQNSSGSHNTNKTLFTYSGLGEPKIYEKCELCLAVERNPSRKQDRNNISIYISNSYGSNSIINNTNQEAKVSPTLSKMVKAATKILQGSLERKIKDFYFNKRKSSRQEEMREKRQMTNQYWHQKRSC